MRIDVGDDNHDENTWNQQIVDQKGIMQQFRPSKFREGGAQTALRE